MYVEVTYVSAANAKPARAGRMMVVKRISLIGVRCF